MRKVGSVSETFDAGNLYFNNFIMRTKNIPSEILTEIFAFLPRRNLLSARGVNNKFNTIIRSDFSTNPLLIIDVFFYGHDKCAWIASKENSQDYAFMPTELASELLRTQKFLRFRESTIQLGNQPISTEFIEAINHTWDQEHLNVEWTYLAPSPAFIKNILSCRTLKLHCDGALSGMFLEHFYCTARITRIPNEDLKDYSTVIN